MSKQNCELVRDLLPLYAENMCSEESRRVVSEHLAECPSCLEQLKKMNTDISVHADNDISAIRRIKKRLLIERIGITAAVTLAALLALWFFWIFMVATTTPMHYDSEQLQGNVMVEEDDNGDLWLVLENDATAADICHPTIRDTQGNYLGYDKDFDREHQEALGIVLEIQRAKAVTGIYMMKSKPERMMLINKDEKPNINEVVYYDPTNDTEYTLWERK